MFMRPTWFRRWRLSIGIAIGLVGIALVIPPVVGALLAESAGPISATAVRSETAPNFYASTTLGVLPGAQVGILVPANQTRMVLVSFSAASRCTGPAGGVCEAQIFVDNAAMNPTTLAPFDNTANNNFSAHAITRWLRVGAGNHTVQVRRNTNSSLVQFAIDGWSLEV